MGRLIAIAVIWWTIMALLTAYGSYRRETSKFWRDWLRGTQTVLRWPLEPILEPILEGPKPIQIERMSAMEESFGGETFDADRDQDRLDRLYDRVFALMSDGKWRTLPEIAKAASGSQTSVSARLRDFRKIENGGHSVDREHVADGLHRYRLVLARPQDGSISVEDRAHV